MTTEQKDYLQFMYHFQYPQNSIDARNISEVDFEFLKRLVAIPDNKLQIQSDDTRRNRNVAIRLFKDWFPEYLI